MNQQTPIIADTTPGIVTCDKPEGFGAIKTPDCAAVLWQRRPDPGFQTWIDALDPVAMPAARLILRPGDVRPAVTEVCDIHDTPDGPERARLIDDIVALADIFADVMTARQLRLRLSPVDTNACRRFHIDALTARLICTYRGTGTQYGISTDGGLPRRIFTAPTGAPVVLRGADWPEHPASGLLHRSPPIEGTGETRLVLVLDPILDPEYAV